MQIWIVTKAITNKMIPKQKSLGNSKMEHCTNDAKTIFLSFFSLCLCSKTPKVIRTDIEIISLILRLVTKYDSLQQNDLILH